MTTPEHLPALLSCIEPLWQPKIGDPSLIAWIITAAYAIAFGVSLKLHLIFRQSAMANNRAESFFWIATMALLAFLSINKQLDLQTLLIMTGRCEAEIAGWYQDRRSVQQWFIITLLTICSIVGIWFSWLLRHALQRLTPVVIGLVTLLLYIAVRAISFNHVDTRLGTPLIDWELRWVFELGGIVVVTIGMLSVSKHYKHHQGS